MKFIWEADDLWPGRLVFFNAMQPGMATSMVFCDNSIGGAYRFGLVSMTDGLVSRRGMKQTDLAQEMNDQGQWAPVSLDRPTEDDDDE